MKFGVSLYSYYRLLQKHEIDIAGCVRKSKELGFDAIEAVDFINFSSDSSKNLTNAESLRREAEKNEIEIAALCISSDLLNGSDCNLEAEIARIKGFIDVAAVLGTKKFRHDITPTGYSKTHGTYLAFETMVQNYAASCREIAEYAASKNIISMTENHGFYSQDSERVEELYHEVNHENFGLLCDMGNFLCADEDPAKAVVRVAPFAKHVHAKDFLIREFGGLDPGEGYFRSRGGKFLRGTIVGHGQVPVKQALHILKKAGYDDIISIEFEGLEDIELGLKIGLQNLKNYWKQV